jgi:RNA polymerase sigma factor (sigma-70 family)
MQQREFEQLYAEHAQALLGFLVYRTGSRALAEDLLADTFERVLRTRAPFDPRRGSRKTWLYTIALNVLRDQMRRREAESRALASIGSGPVTEGAMEDEVGERTQVLDALKVLSDEERQVVALRYGADLTVPEVARVTGEKLTTVEGRVYRALRKLRQELE